MSKLRNGNITYYTGTTTYQSVACLNCNPGYMINGIASAECTSTGTWSNDIPKCIKKGI